MSGSGGAETPGETDGNDAAGWCSVSPLKEALAESQALNEERS